MRLFVSLPLPPTVQDHLDLAVSSVTVQDPVPDVRRGPRALRWVPVEQRHITLAFYGEVADGALGELTDTLTETVGRFPTLRLQLRGAGVFSRRTLWVGVHEGGRAADGRWLWDEENDGGQTGRLVDLMAAVEDAAEPFSHVERRDRRRAHVTVARLSNRRPDGTELVRRAQALSVYAGPPWTATHAHLVVSELGAGKGGSPIHEPVAELPLAGTTRSPAR